MSEVLNILLGKCVKTPLSVLNIPDKENQISSTSNFLVKYAVFGWFQSYA